MFSSTRLLNLVLLVTSLGAICCSRLVLEVDASCGSTVVGAGFMSCRSLLQQTAGEDESMITVAVPSAIAVPDGSRLLGALRAVGHQHYSYNGTAWVLYNATAWLYEEMNGSMAAAGQMGSEAVVGVHFFLAQPDGDGGQPSWRLGSSRITAKSVAATTVSSDSITWNLLRATSYQLIVIGGKSSNSSASSSTSWVGEVSSVQRLDTQRGLPPPDAAASAVGTTSVSVYSALYAFYAAS